MADLLAQFDLAEKAQSTRGERDEAALGDGSSGARNQLNPFDGDQLQPSSGYTMQVYTHHSCLDPP